MILVTGASGLLGASLVGVAREQGREVVGVYHRHRVDLAGAALVSVDLTEESEARRVLAEFKPSSIIHCAAATNVDWCQEHREAAQAINVAASGRLAEIAALARTRMLYVSTDSVFDGEAGHYSETDLPGPVNVYAQTKLQGEEAVLALNPLAAIARVNLYGWNRQPKQSLAEWILAQLMLGNVVPGFADVVFCPILADDLARVLLAMLDHQLVGTYHVAGSEQVSKYEFARRTALTFGFDPARVVPARLADASLKAPRPRNTSLNTGKICAALDCSLPDVDAGLLRFAQLQAAGRMGRAEGQLSKAQL